MYTRQGKNYHHTRRQTGLRNKTRSGKGTYTNQVKLASADRYGTYRDGILIRSEAVAGHVITRQLPTIEGRR